MALRLHTPPAVEPVTLAEAKTHLRLGPVANYAVGTATQTVTLPAPGSYTMTVEGTGTVAAAAGTAEGTGWGLLTAPGTLALNVTQAGTVVLTITEAAEVPEDPGPPVVPAVPAQQLTGLTLCPTALEDALLTALIVSAREQVEALTRRALVTQTWALHADRFQRLHEIPLPPLQSVTEVTYTDNAGAVQTLDPSAYQVDTSSEPGRLVPAYGTTWPCARAVPNAVSVEYVAGYGDSASDVPQPLRHAVLLLVAKLYEHREGLSENALSGVSDVTVEALCAPYRVLRW